MKLTKSETINMLKNGYYDMMIKELKELASYVGTTYEKIVQWGYGWHPEHVAELLHQTHPRKFVD